MWLSRTALSESGFDEPLAELRRKKRGQALGLQLLSALGQTQLPQSNMVKAEVNLSLTIVPKRERDRA